MLEIEPINQIPRNSPIAVTLASVSLSHNSYMKLLDFFQNQTQTRSRFRPGLK